MKNALKILIVSATFYPQNTPRAFRTTELAKEFIRRGHNVTVIFPDNNYDYTELQDEYSGLIVYQDKHLKWGYGSKKSNVSWIRHKCNRLQGMLFEYPAIEWYFKMPQILNNRKDYDLLISIAVPHPIHWGIARCYRNGMEIAKTWIADCGDPYMGCKTESYKKPFYFAWFEKLFCKYADYISIPAESVKGAYYKQYWDKIRVIPQGFDFNEVQLAEYIPNNPISFCFAGGFIPGIRDPRPLLDALIKVDIDFRFYVYTKQKYIFDPYINELGEKLILKDYVARIELLKFMSTMDFLLNIENGTSVQIPSKLIDYSLTKRPILSLDSQDLDIIKLEEFLSRNYSQRFIMLDLQQYSIDEIARKFEGLSKS